MKKRWRKMPKEEGRREGRRGFMWSSPWVGLNNEAQPEEEGSR